MLAVPVILYHFLEKLFTGTELHGVKHTLGHCHRGAWLFSTAHRACVSTSLLCCETRSVRCVSCCAGTHPKCTVIVAHCCTAWTRQSLMWPNLCVLRL